MIGQLKGIIVEKMPPQIMIDVHGVGYDVAMPMTCFYELPDIGHEVTVLTHFVVREDAQLLYGFNLPQERILFRELIKVNGVGPKLALAILSGMSASQFIQAVDHGEIKMLVKLPGVGTKTAERLIVEMKDRLKKLSQTMFNGATEKRSDLINSSSHYIAENNIEDEAISALLALGYKQMEALKIIKRVITKEMDSQTLIKEALKSAL